MGAFGDGVIDPNAATIDLLVAHGILRSLSILDMLKVDEAKPAGTPSLKKCIIRNKKYELSNNSVRLPLYVSTLKKRVETLFNGNYTSDTLTLLHYEPENDCR
jgi:hypothetical protein